MNDKNQKKSSIYKQYLFFVFFAPLFLLIITVLAAWINYNNVEQNQRNHSFREAIKVEKIFRSGIVYIEQFSKIIGRKLENNNSVESLEIGELLQKTYSVARISSDIFSLSMFGFTSPEGYIIASTLEGALKEPIKVTAVEREWIKLAPKEPWTLHFLKPAFGLIADKNIGFQYAIPIGYGITNKKGKFLGTISVGYDISKLTSKIEEAINSQYTSFIILSTEYDIIVAPGNIKNIPNKEFFKNYLINNFSLFPLNEGFLKKSISYNGVNYNYYQKVEPYPYIILIGQREEGRIELFKELVLPQIIETFTIGLFLLYLLYFFLKKVIKPISELSLVAKKIAYEDDVQIHDSDLEEISTLANNLKEIQKVKKGLYNTQSLLRDANKGLAEQIREKIDELEKALEVKTEFLNNISHEVRTPIHGVTAITQGIVDHWDDLEEDRKKDLAKQAAMAANRLFSLVNNILDLSKMTNNKMDLHLVNTDLVNLAKEVIEESRELYLHDKKVDLVIKEPEQQIPVLLIDKQLVTQVFRNLITNAIKFTKEGKIEISLERKNYVSPEGEEGIYIRIKDEGVGIPKGEEKEIFGAFTQSTRTKTRAGGTGLGLAICKEIVEMHAGKIWAENNSDKGASFYFVLPIDQDIEERTKQGEIREVPKVNILLIDDERLCIESMKMMLAGSEFEITGAEGGSAGLAYLGANSSKVDLILLDMMMPDMYGLDVLEKIKNNPQLDYIPVILQTGLKKEDEIQKAYDLGIVNFIGKPYKKEEILKVLRTSVRFKYNQE